MQLKQFIPKRFCLKCDVCCRFQDKYSIWAPLFLIAEIKYLVGNNILPPLLFTTSYPIATKEYIDNKKDNTAQHINLIRHKDYFICPCFDPSDSKCKIYINRPFECQLYPFLLTRKDNKFYLALDKKCLFLKIANEDRTKNYIDYIEKEFNKKEAKDFLKQNEELFTEYPATDLKLLFQISL